MLYDADRIEELASTTNEQDLYEAQCSIFLDPNDPAVIAAARAEGINEDWIIAAKKSPIYKMAIDWKIAFPMHPEFRTLPMVWYVPPLSPIQSQIDQGNLPLGPDGAIPQAGTMRTPVGPCQPAHRRQALIVSALNCLIASAAGALAGRHRGHLWSQQASRKIARNVLLAIANYEDRFAIPTGRRSGWTMPRFQGQNGFTFGNDSSAGSARSPRSRGVKKRWNPELAPPADKTGRKYQVIYKNTIGAAGLSD
jgi:nitrate reductase beta subunit